MFTPSNIASAQTITGLCLSKDGSRLLYAYGSLFQPTGSSKTSTLWIANTTKELSAHPLIPSSNNSDHSPSFHPVSNDVYFLSDRHSGSDGPTHIYRFAENEDEPQPVAAFGQSENVLSYAIAPDGSHIAFVSVKTPEKNREADKEEIEVWGSKKTPFGALYVHSLNSPNEIRTLVSTDSFHVASFSWSTDGTSIAYRLQRGTDNDSRFKPIIEALISLESGTTCNIVTHPKYANSSTFLTSSSSSSTHGVATYLQDFRFKPESILSASALHINDFSQAEKTTMILYGETEDALNMKGVQSNDQVAVEVYKGLERRIDVVDVIEKKILSTLVQWKGEHVESWDIRFDPDPVDGGYIIAVLRSSAVTGELPEVWLIRTGRDATIIDSITKKGFRLSNHHSSFSPDQAPTSRALQWTSGDGETVHGIVSHPRGVKDLSTLPAVIYIHSGPYSAEHFELCFDFLEWRTFLASNGYVVLSPNYRGSSGGGDKFARTKGLLGSLDWDDIHTMILEAIKLGLIDGKNLAITGYSMGGFLTTWGCTRPVNNEYTFKAGVCGAGPTNWGSFAESTDLSNFGVQFGVGAPWIPGEPAYLHSSPIRDACNVRCPILFLYGKQDAMVPPSQAIAMMRGIESVSKAPKPELVLYPREGHIFHEAGNVEDMYKRLLGFLDKHMK